MADPAGHLQALPAAHPASPQNPAASEAIATLRAAWPEALPSFDSILATFPLGISSLRHLLGFSPISVQKLLRHPEDLAWLADPAISASGRGYRRMRHDLELEKQKMGGAGFDRDFKALRRVKSREMLRIALRDLASASTVQATTAELSALAELCLREVTDAWLREMSAKSGGPATAFTVLGMGKLGGRELNYSSDIDVIFFYDQEGALNSRYSYHEFFTRLAENIISTFARGSADGPLFRIDLRLRPEGGSGPLVRSMMSMENYYSGFGETWERMAMIKARCVSGDEELAYDFLQRLQPFCYPRTLSSDLLEEVAAIKHRIERDIVGSKQLERHLKLGRGGIREIEFVVQTLQLIYGARHAFLQETSTLEALDGLSQLDLLPAADIQHLTEAYLFLRTVEHRLQIEEERQTHTLPEDAAKLAKIAMSMGFPDGVSFRQTLDRHTKGVRAIFDRVMEGRKSLLPDPPKEHTDFFEQPEQAKKELERLAANPSGLHQSSRTRQLFERLRPSLFATLREVADPDAALAGFSRFVEIYGIRGLLFETLILNPKLLELLIRLFDSGRFLTEVVLRRPQLIEEIARRGLLYTPMTLSGYRSGYAANDENLPLLEWMRVYRRAQILRIFLRDVLDLAPLEEIHQEYSALAEAALLQVRTLLPSQHQVSVIALGKFGGMELSYGSDLDVLLIGENQQAASALTKEMGRQSPEGILFPIDARLRPEGHGSPLAVPLSRFESYYRERAQLWEIQSLTRVRAVDGVDCVPFLRMAQAIWREAGERQDLAESIREMHERVASNRAANDYLSFKTGKGGLMTVEFLCQALQMRHGIWEPNTQAAFHKLREAGALSPAVAEEVLQAHFFLRKLETVLRRMDNSSVSELPPSETEQAKLARRVGFSNSEKFQERYLSARAAILAAFQNNLG